MVDEAEKVFGNQIEALGKIEYQIISVSKALVEIEFAASKAHVDKILKRRKGDKYVMIVVDVSGSMDGTPIQSVNKAATKFITRY